MNSKFLLLPIILFLFIGCNQKSIVHKDLDLNKLKKYQNTGFTLIYNKKLYKNKKISKKLDDRSLFIFHKSLKKNSFVKIRNPINQKSIIVEVLSNNVLFSDFYNSVISTRVAEELSLNLNEPYVSLILVSQNSSFVAKKAKTFDEEKKVAEKAPIDGVIIDNLGTPIIEKKIVKIVRFNYIIKIADFYYQDSAQNMVNRIKSETNLTNHKIIKLSKTKYRVLLGPFNDIKNIEESFNKMKSLNFENLEILKNV